MSWAKLLVGDVRARIHDIEDHSVDLVVTSPPFWALRDYGGHTDEMGREASPAAFLDSLLSLTAEFRRVLTPFGSIAIELGDTYAGSGGSGGDYGPGGMREGQRKVRQQSTREHRPEREGTLSDGGPRDVPHSGGHGPLAKSLMLVPGAYSLALAYGWNPLVRFGSPSPAGQWRVRNVIVWSRPNPARGALGDKVQPATSYITVACVSSKRYFDLDAIRTEPKSSSPNYGNNSTKYGDRSDGRDYRHESIRFSQRINNNEAGVPPLDYWTDELDDENDYDPTDHLTLTLATQGYDGAHFATWPKRLVQRLIAAMCPLRVCTTCGKPSTRITTKAKYVNARTGEPADANAWNPARLKVGNRQGATGHDNGLLRQTSTESWSDCGHGTWRAGVVFDPFTGSGTTLAVAQGMARSAVGIELYEANAELVRQRVGMFLDVS